MTVDLGLLQLSDYFVLLSSCIVFFDRFGANVRVEVLKLVARKMSVLWDMMPCRLGDKYGHFRETTLLSSEYMALTNKVLPYINVYGLVYHTC